MAWIINQNTATRRLFDAEIMDEPVEFFSTGRAQTDAETAQALAGRYDSIELED